MAFTRAADNLWPTDPNIYKLEYTYEEAEAKYGKDPREYLIQTKKIVADEKGNLKELHTIHMEKILAEDGFHFFEEIPGTEKIWLNIVNKKIAATIKDYATNVDGVFTAGDARKGQSLIVWAIKEGRDVAEKVNEYLCK